MGHRGTRRRSHGPRFAVSLICLLFATATMAYDPRPHRLSLIDDPFIPNVYEAQISPDGEWIVWRQQGSSPSLRRLFSARRWAGSIPIPLTPQIGGTSPSLQFLISPDGRFVVFVSRGLKDGKTEAWSIPIDGSSDAVRLSPFTTWDPYVDLILVGNRAILTGYFNTQSTREVWSAPADGSAPAVRLNPEMAPGAPSIFSMTWPRNESVIAFEADVENDGHLDLWLSSVDGSSPAQRLNAIPGNAPGVVEYSSYFNPDGSWVLYQEAGATGLGEVWTVPVQPLGKARRISPVGHWGATTRSMAGVVRTLLVSDSDDDTRGEIWCVPIEGPPTAAVQLAEAALDYGSIYNYSFFFDANEANVIFRAKLENLDREEIWRAPVDGSQAATRISPPVQHSFPVYSVLYPPMEGASTTYFKGNYLTREDVGFWKAWVDGGQPNVRLDVPPAQGVTWYPSGRSATHVIYADFEPLDSSSLWSVAPEMPVVPIRLSEPRPSPWNISDIRFAPSLQRVVYLAQPGTPVGQELFAVPVDGPAEASVRLNPELPEGGQVYEIVTISPDSEGVLFLAVIDGPRLELWISDAMIFKADLEEGDTSEWSSEQGAQ